ncbi:MAG: SIR2 family protein, partial [Candidatus Hydrogenedentes bacterium]|nr:SIR2 family protein [Candidatus Hydrogenedentota bacterium]
MMPSDELAPLATLIENEPHRVLVVVGTGVTRGATSVPQASSWQELLLHGVRHLVNTKIFTSVHGDKVISDLKKSFSPFDLDGALKHAENIEQNLRMLKAEDFAEWLRTAFQNLNAEPDKDHTLMALRDLREAGLLLLTTNYDSLLSEVTGLPPVTWDNQNEFVEVVTGRRAGILHIHGHWQRPDSVVFGRRGYRSIAANEPVQTALKSLWLDRSWLYVGCGDGLEDPNLGRLLEWGKGLGPGTWPDYYLAKNAEAHGLSSNPRKPPNLVCVGYRDHSDLPAILRSLTPAARTWPFVRLDESSGLFRIPGSDIPFPSLEEYLRSEVPSLAADSEVLQRLDRHRWAFISGTASVGKTTLALRIATAPQYRDHPSFYVDLGKLLTVDDDGKLVEALRRVARSGALFIVDNAHRRPELARDLWERWSSLPRQSKLLLIATEAAGGAMRDPREDLQFFLGNAANPGIKVTTAPEDLARIVEHVFRRAANGSNRKPPVPPAGAVKQWQRTYGSALHAFYIAVLGNLSEFQRGNWKLPYSSASDWVRKKWLKGLERDSLENLLCLAVFGAQEFEIDVLDQALPHPGRVRQLLERCLLVRTKRGQFGQYHSYSLCEPGWGQLILAAQDQPINQEQILFDAAVRSVIVAMYLDARLSTQELNERRASLWMYLATQPDEVLARLLEAPLSYIARFAVAASCCPGFAGRIWDLLYREQDTVVARVWETPLHFVASFLDTAKRRGRDVNSLWDAIEKDKEKIAVRAWETPLGDVASFLNTAKRHGRDVNPLWTAMEKDKEKLVERAWETPLHFVATFLDTAKRHGRDVNPLWTAMEKD